MTWILDKLEYKTQKDDESDTDDYNRQALPLATLSANIATKTATGATAATVANTTAASFFTCMICAVVEAAAVMEVILSVIHFETQ